jgi:parafibromin
MYERNKVEGISTRSNISYLFYGSCTIARLGRPYGISTSTSSIFTAFPVHLATKPCAQFVPFLFISMATSASAQQDPLLLLRQSIASENQCVPTTTPDATSASSVDLSLAKAKYLQFSSPVQLSIPLNTPTRFISSSKPVDLRSIYFAWLKRETAIPEYNASALALNTELKAEGGAGGEVQNLAFVERLDLITWLEGASEESEYIKPLAEQTSSAVASAKVAAGTKGGIAPVTSTTGAPRAVKTVDPRLAEIYNGERRMGDRNSVLRGIKPTVCLLAWTSALNVLLT